MSGDLPASLLFLKALIYLFVLQSLVASSLFDLTQLGDLDIPIHHVILTMVKCHFNMLQVRTQVIL